ncbi:hypothetical protein KEM52_003385 [Ascosphaera acerosa]|nr:hypothetical protein KEM52_003385 [Ascosphaera acerosa]
MPGEHAAFTDPARPPLALRGLDPEVLVLLFPMQRALAAALHALAASSLLPSELQVLTSALINLLLHARAPHAVVLKAVLWVGGTILLVACAGLCRAHARLASIPRWRFRKPRRPVGAATRSRARITHGYGWLASCDQAACAWLCRVAGGAGGPDRGRRGTRADSTSSSRSASLSFDGGGDLLDCDRRHARFMRLALDLDALRGHPESVLQHSDLYITIELCSACASLLRRHHIRHVYYGCANDDPNAVGGLSASLDK